MQNQLVDILAIHHNSLNLYPYWTDDLIKKWQKEVTNLIIKVNKGLDTFLFYKELMKLSAILDDGHTMIYLPHKIKEKLLYSPVTFGLIEDNLVIVSGNKVYESLFYHPITKINHQNKEQFLTNVKTYFWPSHPHFSLQNPILNSSLFLGKKEIKIEFEKGQKIKIPFISEPYQENIDNSLKININYDILTESDSLVIYQINDNVLIRIKHFMSKDVVTHFYACLPSLENAKEIIFDLRHNFGGNSGFADEISQAFFKEPLIMEKSFRQVIDSEDIANATMIFFDESVTKESDLEAYKKLNHQFLKERLEKSLYKEYAGLLSDKSVSIIQNELTYSSAENFIINFDNKNRATLIGQKTAGSTGQPALIKLKTGGTFMVTAKKVLYPNGTHHHNLGINPDIMINDSLKSQHEQEDLCLSYVLNK